jgi:hypothetical protein
MLQNAFRIRRGVAELNQLPLLLCGTSLTTLEKLLAVRFQVLGIVGRFTPSSTSKLR